MVLRLPLNNFLNSRCSTLSGPALGVNQPRVAALSFSPVRPGTGGLRRAALVRGPASTFAPSVRETRNSLLFPVNDRLAGLAGVTPARLRLSWRTSCTAGVVDWPFISARNSGFLIGDMDDDELFAHLYRMSLIGLAAHTFGYERPEWPSHVCPHCGCYHCVQH